jgi:precorrin-6B methylase 2
MDASPPPVVLDITPSPTSYGTKLAPFNPTHTEALSIVIDLLNLSSSDIFVDIGCGDARLLIEASKQRGTQGIGVEYDPSLCDRARANITTANITNVTIIQADATTVDLSSATALFIYLVPEGIRAVRPVLIQALERGASIVSYIFAIPDLIPTEVSRIIYR